MLKIVLLFACLAGLSLGAHAQRTEPMPNPLYFPERVPFWPTPLDNRPFPRKPTLPAEPMPNRLSMEALSQWYVEPIPNPLFVLSPVQKPAYATTYLTSLRRVVVANAARGERPFVAKVIGEVISPARRPR